MVAFFAHATDHDVDLMTFIYELHPYALKIYRMSEKRTSYVKAIKSYCLKDRQTDRQTDRHDGNYYHSCFANCNLYTMYNLQTKRIQEDTNKKQIQIQYNTIQRWRLGVVVSVVGRINEVNQHRARLVHDG